MRANDAVGKHGQKITGAREQGRTAPAVAWHRRRGTAMDTMAVDSNIVAEMVPEAAVPLAGHRAAVV